MCFYDSLCSRAHLEYAVDYISGYLRILTLVKFKLRVFSKRRILRGVTTTLCFSVSVLQ